MVMTMPYPHFAIYTGMCLSTLSPYVTEASEDEFSHNAASGVICKVTSHRVLPPYP